MRERKKTWHDVVKKGLEFCQEAKKNCKWDFTKSEFKAATGASKTMASVMLSTVPGRRVLNYVKHDVNGFIKRYKAPS